MQCDLCGRDAENYGHVHVIVGNLVSKTSKRSGNVITTTMRYSNFNKKPIFFC